MNLEFFLTSVWTMHVMNSDSCFSRESFEENRGTLDDIYLFGSRLLPARIHIRLYAWRLVEGFKSLKS